MQLNTVCRVDRERRDNQLCLMETIRICNFKTETDGISGKYERDQHLHCCRFIEGGLVGIKIAMRIQPFGSTRRKSVSVMPVRHHIGIISEIMIKTESVPEFMDCVNNTKLPIKTATGGRNDCLAAARSMETTHSTPLAIDKFTASIYNN